MKTTFFPMTRAEMKSRGWDELDVLLITGDAYVDHPAYGAAVIGRVLEAAGFRVGIAAQPDWKKVEDFQRLGRPRLFVGIASGNVDSLVANYTANKRPRVSDDYSPGGKGGLRPDRAVIVYANRVREAFNKIPIVIGGIEASLRRLAHYDYWDDRVRRSILLDSRADILVYGMGETPVLEIARRLKEGAAAESLDGIRGTAVVRNDASSLAEKTVIPSAEEAAENPEAFNRAFALFSREQDPFRGKPVVQPHGNRVVIQYPPPPPMRKGELDRVYELPYARAWHPAYDRAGGVPGFETVRFSLISHRGCCGECSFCSLSFHQGRIVQSRSPDSIVREAHAVSRQPGFKGTITDIGGPTANLYLASCARWAWKEACEKRHCLTPTRCPNRSLGYRPSLELYRRVKELPGVKHVFIGSGFRYDLLADPEAEEYLRTVCREHISGRMKVAPEHSEEEVLRLMNKPAFAAYDAFVKKFEEINRGRKGRVSLVNYFLSAHPGAALKGALNLALALEKKGIHPEQVQDFIP
ncbi:MAG: YgiQ family radical SAM protein, partial [Candidatus Aureabacteria bacterium]|nr:YgiQ family radical SAM protein [Candidatus Auribacterota bacterium]